MLERLNNMQSESWPGGKGRKQAVARVEKGQVGVRTCRELHAGPAVLGEQLLVQAQHALCICQAPHLEVAVGCTGARKAEQVGEI